MITPIRTMKINDICQRKDDLLMSADDIEEIAKNVRAKAIDEFAEKLIKHISQMPSGYIGSGNVLIIAEQLKAGVNNDD